MSILGESDLSTAAIVVGVARGTIDAVPASVCRERGGKLRRASGLREQVLSENRCYNEVAGVRRAIALFRRGGKSGLHRAGWPLTAARSDPGKVAQKKDRPQG